MADKEKIKEEIERQKSFCKKTFDVLHPDDLDATIAYAQIELLDRLLQFIDSLPEESGCEVNFTTKSENLEEEIKNWIKTKHFVFTEIDEVIETAKHFAEWQKQKDFEDLFKSDMTMPNKFYEKGRFDMREEMMKDAIECVVEDWCGDSPEITIPLNPQDFKTGDKVKIKICKTE